MMIYGNKDMINNKDYSDHSMEKDYNKSQSWGKLHGDIENTKKHIAELCEEAIYLKGSAYYNKESG